MLFDEDVSLTDFGTFNGEVKLPDDAQLGQAQIRVRYVSDYDASGYFTVSEFRVPEYKVEVTPDYPSIIQGDPPTYFASYYWRAGRQCRPELNAYGETPGSTTPGNQLLRRDPDTSVASLQRQRHHRRAQVIALLQHQSALNSSHDHHH
jgi:hypothetical protein